MTNLAGIDADKGTAPKKGEDLKKEVRQVIFVANTECSPTTR